MTLHCDILCTNLAVVIGVPFKPLLTKVNNKQCGAVEFFWEVSRLVSGGGSETNFQAQMRRRGYDWRDCTNFTTSRSCLFKDLSSENDYDIRVRAENQRGLGDWRNGTITTGAIGRYAFLTSKKEHDNGLIFIYGWTGVWLGGLVDDKWIHQLTD